MISTEGVGTGVGLALFSSFGRPNYKWVCVWCPWESGYYLFVLWCHYSLTLLKKKLIKIVYFRGRLLAHNKAQIAVKGGWLPCSEMEGPKPQISAPCIQCFSPEPDLGNRGKEQLILTIMTRVCLQGYRAGKVVSLSFHPNLIFVDTSFIWQVSIPAKQVHLWIPLFLIECAFIYGRIFMSGRASGAQLCLWRAELVCVCVYAWESVCVCWYIYTCIWIVCACCTYTWTCESLYLCMCVFACMCIGGGTIVLRSGA